MKATFGQYLKNLRKTKKITLVELAQKTGLSQPYLSQIENNKRGQNPTVEIITKLANGLGVSNSDLLSNAGYGKREESMNLRVDIYSCEGCGRAVVVESDQEVEICPYQYCSAALLEYSHSGHVVNE